VRLNILGEVLKIILRFTLPILVVILIFTLIKIINNYRKYGTKIFSSFKKYNLNGKMKDLVVDMLERESHKEILIVECTENSFYAITNYNIFSIFVFDYNYSLNGNINAQYLKSNKTQIENPLLEFIDKNNKIRKTGITFETIYINSKKDVKINIEGISEVFTLKDFSYKLYQKQHSNFKYSKEDLIELKKKIEDIINGHN